MGHPVEGLAEIYSDSQNSSRILGGVVKVFYDEIGHSDDVVYNGTARKTTKLISTIVRINIPPYPFNKQVFNPLTHIRS